MNGQRVGEQILSMEWFVTDEEGVIIYNNVLVYLFNSEHAIT